MDYFTLPELPGKPMFRCERMAASLPVEACAGRWREANGKGTAEHLFQCKNCPIGAMHAGAGEISLSPLRGASVCARCEMGTARMVRKHLCVSCYNREREYILGRNAKGVPPKMHPPMHHIEIRFQAGEEVRRMALQAVSVQELVIAALRDTSKQVMFGFNGRASWASEATACQ